MKDGGTVTKEPLPLITIYILGYFLSKTLPAVIKVNRQYIDLLADVEIAERNDFIDCLTHDSYVIQIPGLHLQMKNRLEYVLSIFKQERFIGNDLHLKDYDYEIDDELMKMILKQLGKAAANQEILRQLELEELAYSGYDNRVGRIERELELTHKKLDEKDQVISEKDQALSEKDQAIEENDQLIAELLKKLGK
jgi:hypothetical protein